jgi:hypothetical protein
LNLRPPGPQPGALPDCATPRGSAPDSRAIRRNGRPLRMRTYVRASGRGPRSHTALLTMWGAPAGFNVCLAPPRPGAARHLLPRVPSRIQTRALSRQPRALHRSSDTPKRDAHSRAGAVPRRVSSRATLHRLRRVRPGRAGVRSPGGQGVRHLGGAAGPQMGGRAPRDRQVRGRLCKLSPSADRPPWRFPARGCSSTVEPRPSKAMMRVQFSSAASRARRRKPTCGQRQASPSDALCMCAARTPRPAGPRPPTPTRALQPRPRLAAPPPAPRHRPRPAPAAATARASCREPRRA